MGTDINLIAEIKKDDGWEVVALQLEEPKFESDEARVKYLKRRASAREIYDGTLPDERTELRYQDSRLGWAYFKLTRELAEALLKSGIYGGCEFPEPCHERNYDLFALIANVRNLDVEDGGFESMTNERGLSKDASIEARFYMTCEMGHSPGYVTAEEIENWPAWERAMSEKGLIPLVADESRGFSYDYLTWREEKSCPSSYCHSISGPTVRKISSEEAEDLVSTFGTPRLQEMYQIDDQLRVEQPRIYVQIAWSQTYRECAGATWWRAVEALKKACPNGDLSRGRFLFSFDC